MILVGRTEKAGRLRSTKAEAKAYMYIKARKQGLEGSALTPFQIGRIVFGSTSTFFS
jgi:hypothetical protein